MNLENKEMPSVGEQTKISPELNVPEVVAPQERPSTAPSQPAPQNNVPKTQVKNKIDLKVSKNDNIEETEDLEASDTDEIDARWVESVDAVIEKDKSKPYEEQEDAHKLSIKYLLKRFGKIINKDK